MAKKKAKRYSDAEKKKILDFITAQGRGGQTKAVKKFGVTPATISAWRKKSGEGAGNGLTTSGSSKELKTLQELATTLSEIEGTKGKLALLEKRYKTLKARL